MREGEKKRARTKAAENGTSSARGKEKELEVKMREIKSRQKKLQEFIKEFDDGCVDIFLANSSCLNITL